jgi:antitoxin component of MazEF toxin-antitoxin module
MDGIMFVKNIRSYGSVSGVTIPKKIMKGYGFENGDLVEIKIRKVE